ncbi:MAG: hypothetical protein BZ151_10320 [Desulfobacca sp. 4484_104]|nr:MAG: hypothetical protein BZ151_10320 [Desulfobacca sp. 4484_104]RLA87586.1 MAG: hypothetical protein DRG58_10410 [Deltaproteobacteria bacterium]
MGCFELGRLNLLGDGFLAELEGAQIGIHMLRGSTGSNDPGDDVPRKRQTAGLGQSYCMISI